MSPGRYPAQRRVRAPTGRRAALVERAPQDTDGVSFTQQRRLDRLCDLLAGHPGGVTLYELAGMLKVDPRTVRRYLKEVERHYELSTLQPRGGGPLRWRIRQSELPRKVEMRRMQIYALLAARRIFDPLAGSALFDEIDLVLGRLLSFADRPGRGPNAGLGNTRLEDRFVYLPRHGGDYSDKSMELDELFQAVSELRPLDLRYRATPLGGPVSATLAREERLRIHPYALVLHADRVYCVALDVQAAAIRTLCLEGMRETEVMLEERFELPDDFRVEEHFHGTLGVPIPRVPQRAVLELSREVAREVRARQIHPSQKLSALVGGGARLTLSIADPALLLGWVLGLGNEVRVLEPESLRNAVKQQLEVALAQYAPGTKRKKVRRKLCP